METSKEFIIDTLNRWESIFPDIVLKYAYDKLTSYHMITVEPQYVYDSDDFILECNEFVDRFMYRYQDDDIIVSLPDICMNMENLIYSTKKEDNNENK